MKAHTNEFKENIKLFGRELDSKITYTIDSVDYELGSEELNSVEPHYEADILKSVMRQLDIDSNVEIPLNTVINYQFGIKVNDEYEYLNFGNYIVYKVEKQEDTLSYKITCYDKMLYSMIEYEKMNITYPITIRNYINAICNKLGLTFKNANDNFANYDKEILNELYLDSDGNSLGYTFRDVLDELAQVTASTICINEDDDNLEIRYINQTIGKNLFNKDNANILTAYFNKNTTVITQHASNRMIYIECKPNTTYAISKLRTGSDIFFVGYTKEVPNINTQVYDIKTNEIVSGNREYIVITTGEEAYYIVARYYHTTADSGFSEKDLLNSIQIEENNVMTNFEPFGDTINEEYLKDVNVKFGEKYGPVNSIVLSRAGGSDSVYLRDEESITENGLCEIKIEDNQIMNWFDRSDYLPDILNTLNGLEYYTNDFESFGVCYYNVCDRYNVQIDDNTYSCIMLNDDINVTQGLAETIHTDLPQTSETDYTKADKTDRKVAQTYLMVDKQNQQIEALAEKVEITSQTIDSVGSLTLQNAFSGTLHQLSIKGQISLLFPTTETNYGYALVPRDDLVPNDRLTPSNSVPYGNEVSYPSNDLFTKSNVLLVDDIEYKLDIDYLNYINNQICDEFVYEEGKCNIIRRVGINSQGQKYQLDREIIEPRKDIDIQVKSSSVIKMKTFGDLLYSSTYLIQNEYTNTFVPSVDLISRINLSPGNAVIQANKIKLEGYTTINENFGVDLEGNMWARNGSFSGNIYLENGNKVIGGDGLMSVLRFNTDGFAGSNGWSAVGYEFEYTPYGAGSYTDWQYLNTYISYFIPENFTITEAYITLSATPVQSVIDSELDPVVGTCKQLKLYNMDGLGGFELYYYWAGGVEVKESDNVGGTEIKNAFGQESYTPSISYVGDVEEKTSINIKDYLTVGSPATICIKTDRQKPAWVDDETTGIPLYILREVAENSGGVKAELYVYGYMSYEEKESD